jgi:hypothetical protein
MLEKILKLLLSDIWEYTLRIWIKWLLLTLLGVHFFNNYFYFHLSCVVIGVSTPPQLDEAMRCPIGSTGTGTFIEYYYVKLYLLYSIHRFIYILILFPSSTFS